MNDIESLTIVFFSSVLYTENEQINVAYIKCAGNVLVVAVPDHK